MISEMQLDHSNPIFLFTSFTLVIENRILKKSWNHLQVVTSATLQQSFKFALLHKEQLLINLRNSYWSLKSISDPFNHI